MKKIFLLVVAVLAVAALMDASDKSAKSDVSDKTETSDKLKLPEVVATVEGVDIKKSELESALSGIVAASGIKLSDLDSGQKMEAYHGILDQLILEKLMLKLTEKEKVSDEEVEKAQAEFKKQYDTDDQMKEDMKRSGVTSEKMRESLVNSLKEQKWADAQIGDKTNVTEDEAKAFYDKNPEAFQEPETVRASHIFFVIPEDAKPETIAAKEKQAKKAAERLKKGEAFDKVAADMSEDPATKDKGGDLGYFSKDRMSPEFAEASFKMKVDEVSEPVKTEYGIHIIKVTGKKAARTVPYEEAKDKIISYLKDEKKRAALEELITAARKKANIKVFLPEEEAVSKEKPEASASPEQPKEAKPAETTKPPQ